jgi:5-formyltetrahydrofolate cyclo-ligase
MQKSILRKRLKEIRAKLSDIKIQSASEQIISNIEKINGFCTAKQIGIFFPTSKEPQIINPKQINKIYKNMELNAPFITNFTECIMQMHLCKNTNNAILNLSSNKLGILEPENSPIVSLSNLNFLLIPMLGFDEYCNRIGMGAGYYDIMLNKHIKQKSKLPILIGVCFEECKVAKIPTQKHDIQLDFVVTEKNIYLKN